MAVPTVSTAIATGITPYSALSGGTIISDGGKTLEMIGVCWGLTANPVWNGRNATLHDHLNYYSVYQSNILDLLPNTVYHYRAFASNADGVGYDVDRTFTTIQIWTLGITFPIQNVNETETIQLYIEFQHIYEPWGNLNWLAEEHGLMVTKWGNIKSAYDLEEGLLVASEMSLEIGDNNGELDQLFFGILDTTIYKTPKVSITINGIVYGGTIIEDTISSDVGKYLVVFDVSPRTDILNKRVIFGENGSDTLWADKNDYEESTQYSIVGRYLLDAFRLVNPNINQVDIQLIHDWAFQGETGMGDERTFLNDITFAELMQSPNAMLLSNTKGLVSVGDFIKKLAIDYGCFTGFLSEDKPFFKKLFHFEPTNVQEMKVLKWTKGYQYNLIDYVSITLEDAPPEGYETTRGIYTSLADRSIDRIVFPWCTIATNPVGSNIMASISRPNYFRFVTAGISAFPNENDQFTNNGSTFRVAGTPYNSTFTSQNIIMERIQGSNNPLSSGNLIQTVGTSGNLAYGSVGSADGNYGVFQVRDPNLMNNEFHDHAEIMAEFWWNFRGNIQHCRVDKFTLSGCNYDFLKDFVYGTSKYQIISLTLNTAENNSDCEAIYLGEIEG